MTVRRTSPWQATPAHFRAVVIGVMGVAAALLFRAPILLVMATPFAFVAVWSSATRPGNVPTLVGRVAPSTVREGEATAWAGELSELSDVDHVIAFAPERPWLERRPRSGVATAAVRSGDSRSTLSVPMRATHWGRHELGPTNVVAVSSWGAFRWLAVDRDHHVTALPLPEVFDAAPSRQRAKGLVGLNRSAQPGDGTEFSGVRPFRTGDRLRRINWGRSLRSNELHVTATYADQDTHVALFVDARADYGTSGGIDGAASSLDTTVRAAGAIAEYFLLHGDRVSLHVLDSRLPASVPPASGSRHLRRVLDVLAAVEPATNRLRASRGAKAAVPSGALAIFLSPLISPAALERAISIASRGLSVAVVDTLPPDIHVDDDATTELAWRIRLLERHGEMRAIQQVGVPVVAWKGPGSLDPFLREIARRASAPRMSRR